MTRSKRSDLLARSRTTIGTKVRELRSARNLTQRELAARLQLSQSRLSTIERGGGSFTAEQFLELLRLFNVTAGDFVEGARDPGLELQNALARLGATHLHESERAGSAVLVEVHDVVGEALIDGSPRLITALAPVLVHRADSVNLPKLYASLHALGLERRLGWVVENTLLALEALATERGSDARSWAKQQRRAAVPFRLFIDLVGSGHGASWEGPPDALDPTIRSVRTLEEVTRQASKPSQRWGIVTRLQPEDFVDALRASRAAG